MRQAGRAMPGYRALRRRYSFLELCRTPELALQVALEPVERLGVDAAIVFSDILIVGEAMGLSLDLDDRGAPQLTGLELTAASVARLRRFDPSAETGFVLEAIELLRQCVGQERAVIGFAAAPWTLACYMLARHPADTLATEARRLLHADPALLQMLLERIAVATADYLRAQIAAGADAIQLFDTWAGELSLAQYEQFARPATLRLLEELSPGSVPVILFARGAAQLLPGMASLPVTVLSVDWRVDLGETQRWLGQAKSLQGNVDPCALLATPEVVEEAVRRAVCQTGGRGHILNLGHGLHPETPLENAQAFVRAAHQVVPER
jgi:uroporphyrinogen decarboxylase